MSNNRKITLDELYEKVEDPNVNDSELQQFFTNPDNLPATEQMSDLLIIEDSSVNPFTPVYLLNSETVEQFSSYSSNLYPKLLSALNRRAKRARQGKYDKTVRNKSFHGRKIISEGDSWFQYPVWYSSLGFKFNDIIDFLFPLNKKPSEQEYAVYSLGAGGDTLQDIIKRDDISKAMENEVTKSNILLLSAGGVDLLKQFEDCLKGYDPNLSAEQYLNEHFTNLLDSITKKYTSLLGDLTSKYKELNIIIHGYTYIIPGNGRRFWPKQLQRKMERKKICDETLQKEIMKESIDRLNNKMQEISLPERVHIIDCRDLVGENNSMWEDEVHPNKTGYEKIVSKFKETINSIA